MSFLESNLMRFWLCLALVCCVASPAPAMWQGEADQETAAQEAEGKKDDQPDEPTLRTESLKQEAPEVDPQFLRFEMWDGTIVSGVVSIPAIDIETEFGSLEIPIERLVDFRPGLVSLPELRTKVDTLVEQLGDREFRTREAAHRELVAMGPMLVKMLRGISDGGDAERKKHLVKIKEEVEALMDDQEDEDEPSPDSTVAEGDQVQTPDFGIVGKIVQKEFQVKSKIGDLRIMLADVKRADRGMAMKSSMMRKTVYVPGTTFFQKKALSTKIHVSKGDKITITASGIVQWTNWSQTASPDGLPNQGNWNGISYGALAARIGSSGDVFSIGSDHKFTAQKAGILYLGIGMPDNYVNNTGYRWTGKFKAKVKIEPGG